LTVTKLLPPRADTFAVKREGLLRRLSRASHASLVLVAAPAGFGKTNLLRQWRQDLLANGALVAWLNLDSEDDHLRRFCSYLAASLARAEPTLSASLTTLLLEGAIADREALVSALVGDLHRAGREVWLVLDSFESVRSPEIHDFVAQLLHFAPANVHVAIAARAEPDFPRGELAMRNLELVLGPQDLSFSLDETRLHVAQRAESVVTNAMVARLHRATRGWPAGLQLAVAALNGGIPLERYLTGPAGLGRDSAALLAETVIGNLPADDLHLLVSMAVLRRFNAELCSAILGRELPTGTLERIRASQPFVQALDMDGGWYEYHPIFHDWLMRRLEAWPTDKVMEIQRRAAEWFGAHGHAPEAVQQALASGDIATAAAYLEEAVEVTLREGGDPSILHMWLDQLPQDLLTRSPLVCVRMTVGLLLCYRWDDALALLATIDPACLSEDDRFSYTMAQAALSIVTDRTSDALRIADRWPETAPQRDWLVYAAACNISAIAHMHAGNYERARECVQPAMTDSWAAYGPFSQLYVLMIQALLLETQGQMRQAEHLCNKALDNVRRDFPDGSAAVAMVAASSASMLYERSRFDKLDEMIASRLEIIAGHCLPDLILRAYRSSIRAAASRGDLQEAHDLAGQLEALGTQRGLDRLCAVAIDERIRMHLRYGVRADATRLLVRLREIAERYGDLRNDARCEIAILARTAEARLALAQGRPAEAVKVLSDLAAEATRCGRTYAAVALESLHAESLHAAGDSGSAGRKLADALAVGERLGMFRVFLDELDGGVLLDLVQRASGQRGTATPAYIARLVAALSREDGLRASRSAQSGRWAEVPREPISRRERDVLELLARGLTNRQLADALEVSPDTVKYHLKNIFAKLQVVDRRAAVQSARQLGVLDESGQPIPPARMGG
jgi:LuxR family maltose regulon positive regulatory protein